MTLIHTNRKIELEHAERSAATNERHRLELNSLNHRFKVLKEHVAREAGYLRTLNFADYMHGTGHYVTYSADLAVVAILSYMLNKLELDPSVQSIVGTTPEANYSRKLKLAELRVRKLNEPGTHGRTILGQAIKEGKVDIVSIVLAKGGKPPITWQELFALGHSRAVRNLLYLAAFSEKYGSQQLAAYSTSDTELEDDEEIFSSFLRSVYDLAMGNVRWLSALDAADTRYTWIHLPFTNVSLINTSMNLVDKPGHGDRCK